MWPAHTALDQLRLIDASDAHAVGLVAPEDVVAVSILTHIEADMAPALAPLRLDRLLSKVGTSR